MTIEAQKLRFAWVVPQVQGQSGEPSETLVKIKSEKKGQSCVSMWPYGPPYIRPRSDGGGGRCACIWWGRDIWCEVRA